MTYALMVRLQTKDDSSATVDAAEITISANNVPRAPSLVSFLECFIAAASLVPRVPSGRFETLGTGLFGPFGDRALDTLRTWHLGTFRTLPLALDFHLTLALLLLTLLLLI